MPSRTGLVLLVVTLVAVGATVWLLIGGDLLFFTDSEVDRLRREADEAEWLDPGGVRLEGQDGAVSAETRAAEEAAAAAEIEAARRPDFEKSAGVYGVVTDPNGKPIEGAMVHLIARVSARRAWGVPDPPAITSAETDGSGEFLVGPAPAGLLRIRAEAEGYAPTVLDVRRKGYRVEVILDRGGSLEVVVKNTEGTFVEGARVIHQAGAVVTDGLTDESGKVVFPGLPTGTGALFVGADGFAGVKHGDVAVVPFQTERRTIVLGPPLVLEGRVLQAENEVPIAGARVVIRYPSMPWIEETAAPATDDDGRFETRIPLSIGQSMDLEAAATGFAPSRGWYQATDAGGGRMSLEIKLSRGGEGVRGEVVDHRGRPLAGARVTYLVERASQDAPEAKSGRDGYFSLPPVPWASRGGTRVQLVAVSDAGGVGTAYAKIAKEGEHAEPVTLRLSGGGSVTGRVLDGGGQPVAGALVTLQMDWSTAMKLMQERGGNRSPWVLSNVLSNPQYVVLDTVTDDTGRYVLESVPCSVYLVHASYGREQAVSEEPAVVEPGSSTTRDVTLGEGQTIEGVVLDGKDAPVPGAYVSAWPEDRRGRGRTANPNARSQSDGRFVLRGIGQGTWSLRAWASGYQSQRQAGVPPGTKDVTLLLKPLGWIEGVVMHEGRPFQGTFTVRAAIVRQQGNVSSIRGMPYGGGNGNTFNTDDGAFKLRSLQEGEYDVSVQTPEGLIAPASVRVRVAEGRGSPATLTLSSGAVLKGTVVVDRTGEAIASAHVSVQAAPGPDAPVSGGHSRTDNEGRFTVRGLAAGRYLVTVFAPGGMQFRQIVELQAAEVKDLRLRQRAPGQVRVMVRNAAGEAIQGATPRIKDEGGMDIWPNPGAYRSAGIEMPEGGWSAMVRTDASGMNIRYLVPPGRYQVSARMQGYEASAGPWIDVASDRETEIEVVLQRTGGG